jgi:hypothetical protein
MDPLTQKIEEQIKTLPSVTQRALHDFDWKTQILSIGKTYDLNLDQLDTLEQETTLILVGLIPASSYVSELKKRLEISTTAASQIVEDANQKIFMPLRDLVLQYAEEDRDQHATLRDAGIHIGEDSETSTAVDNNQVGETTLNTTPETAKKESIIEMKKEDADLPPMPMKNSIEQKMSGLHTVTQVTSNHSSDATDIPMIPKKPEVISHDPYREPIV